MIRAQILNKAIRSKKSEWVLYVIDGWFQAQENDGNYTLRGLYVDGLCDAIYVFSSSVS